MDQKYEYVRSAEKHSKQLKGGSSNDDKTSRKV